MKILLTLKLIAALLWAVACSVKPEEQMVSTFTKDKQGKGGSL